MRKTLHLYVWEEVFCDYTCGMAVALASSPEEALEMVLDVEWPLDDSLRPAMRKINTEMRERDKVRLGLPKQYDKKVAFTAHGGG